MPVSACQELAVTVARPVRPFCAPSVPQSLRSACFLPGEDVVTGPHNAHGLYNEAPDPSLAWPLPGSWCTW